MAARLVLLLVLYFTKIYAKDVTDTIPHGMKSDGRPSEVETLLGNLLQEQWNEDELPCLEATRALLHGVRNHTLWATWMWDSMQRPTGALYGSRYQLGNFDQCMNPLWGATHPHLGAQYCLADIDMTRKRPRKPSRPVDPFGSTYSYMNKTTKHGRHLNIVTRGVCLPRVCQPHSIGKVVQVMHRDSHLASPVLDPLITVHSCQLAGEQHQYSDGFFAFLYLVAVIFTLAVISTYCLDYIPDNCFVSELAKSFDMKYNYEKFMATSKDEILAADSMKFTTASIGICIHIILFSNSVAFFNGLDYEKYFETTFGFFTIHVDILTDTFYAISGLLLARTLLSDNRKSALKFLLKRYIRLLVPLAVIVFYMACVHPHVGDGPLWPVFSGGLQRACLDNWWLNLLLINNYVNENRICHPVTWYTSTDFQLAVLGTLLCYLYRRNARVGKTAFALSFLVAVLIRPVVTYWRDLPPLFFRDIQDLMVFTTNDAFVHRYIKTQYRAAAYLVGMALGYIMVLYKPVDYRNTISKTWSIAGAAAAFFLMFLVLGTAGALFHHEHGAVQAAMFTMGNRVTWAVAICCIIGLCEYGTIPILDFYLNTYKFVPLSRLCYGIYLSHMAFIYYCIYSIRAPITFNMVTMIFTGLGVGVMSMLLSFLLWIFVEAPTQNLLKYLLDTKRNEAITDGTAKVNEIKNGFKPKVM